MKWSKIWNLLMSVVRCTFISPPHKRPPGKETRSCFPIQPVWRGTKRDAAITRAYWYSPWINSGKTRRLFFPHHNTYSSGANSGQQSALSPSIQSVESWCLYDCILFRAAIKLAQGRPSPEQLKWMGAAFRRTESSGTEQNAPGSQKAVFTN